MMYSGRAILLIDNGSLLHCKLFVYVYLLSVAMVEKEDIIKLLRIDGDFTVCKIDDIAQVDFARDFTFLLKTPDEISLVCESASVPADVIQSEAGWKALKIAGVLEFGQIGIIAKIANILADAEISIFVVSTYDTDYILLKTENYDMGIQKLVSNGYDIM